MSRTSPASQEKKSLPDSISVGSARVAWHVHAGRRPSSSHDHPGAWLEPKATDQRSERESAKTVRLFKKRKTSMLVIIMTVCQLGNHVSLGGFFFRVFAISRSIVKVRSSRCRSS